MQWGMPEGRIPRSGLCPDEVAQVLHKVRQVRVFGGVHLLICEFPEVLLARFLPRCKSPSSPETQNSPGERPTIGGVLPGCSVVSLSLF